MNLRHSPPLEEGLFDFFSNGESQVNGGGHPDRNLHVANTDGSRSLETFGSMFHGFFSSISLSGSFFSPINYFSDKQRNRLEMSQSHAGKIFYVFGNLEDYCVW
jgi:hypothetical protein